MARVNYVEKSRKAQGTCGRGGCDRLIEAGDSYFHWANFRAPKQVRCADHRPRASETAGSDKIGRLYAAQERIEDELESWDGRDVDLIASAVREASEQAADVRDEYQEALDAWESGNAQLEEYVENTEAWVDVLEDAANDIENAEPDTEECPDCAGLGVKVDAETEAPVEPEETCPTCDGETQVPDLESHQSTIREMAETASGELSM